MNRSIVHLLLAGLLCSSCSKNKINALLQPSGSEVATNSSVRLFNFYNYNLDITINNIPLTSYGQSTQDGTQAGLSLFPKGSWLTQDDGNPFFVPNSLVTKDRKVHVQISTVPGTLAGSGLVFNFAAIDTVLTDDPLNPNDYYALSTGHLQVVPRNTQAPVQPDHFKIRVINLGSAMDPNNLTGPVSLTYSDGSPVDPMLTDVPAGGTSGYVDLPYGACMFKLFSNDDFSRQLTELPILPNFNSCAVSTPVPVPQEALWPRVRTFKPGATYSVVVTQNLLIFQPCNSSTPPVPALSNAYRIVTEQSPGPNTTYARMDAFNALPVVPLSIKVDGQALGSLLPYAGHTDYGIYVQGTHQVQAVDAEGNVLVTKAITLSPYDNYTAWIYENTSGQADICFANTDMTSTLYQTDANGDVAAPQPGPSTPPPVDDGTNGTIRVVSINYSWQTRFLNLTPDLPFVTFTNNTATFPGIGFGGSGNTGYGDSTNFPGASINMAPGVTPAYDPFVIFQFECSFSSVGTPSNGFAQQPSSNFPGEIRVFQSTPGPPALVPGTLLGSVAPLPASAYISNPTIYPTPLFTPESEPGVYTTAVIGRALTATSGQDAARLVILKHNK